MWSFVNKATKNAVKLDVVYYILTFVVQIPLQNLYLHVYLILSWAPSLHSQFKYVKLDISILLFCHVLPCEPGVSPFHMKYIKDCHIMTKLCSTP